MVTPTNKNPAYESQWKFKAILLAIIFVLVALSGTSVHAETMTFTCSFSDGSSDKIAITTSEGFRPVLTTFIGSTTDVEKPTPNDFHPMHYEIYRDGDTLLSYFSIGTIRLKQNKEKTSIHLRVNTIYGVVNDGECR